MNNSKLESKLSELEGRIKNLKDWKAFYDKAKEDWDKERFELLNTTKKQDTTVLTLRDTLIKFLGLNGASSSQHAETTKDNINLRHKELNVNVAYQERNIEMTTSTVVGKVIFLASTELNKEGFTEAELSNTLLEHGWNIGHSTLAPTLGGLVKDGTIIKLEGRPAKYRLPTKIKLQILKAE